MLEWDPIRGTRTLPTAQHARRREYPDRDHAAWIDLYALRRRAYLMEDYSAEERRSLGLFAATDTLGNVIAHTRRLCRDLAFVVDKDVAAVARPLSLEVVPAVVDEVQREALQAAGEAIWARSALQEGLELRTRDAAICGSMCLEAVRVRGAAGVEVRIVAYAPESVEVRYDDETGTEIVEAIVRLRMMQPPPVDVNGAIAPARSGTMRTYVRHLTRTEVRVYVDGVYDPAQSGPHFLGRVPLVHASWIPYQDPEHGIGSAWALNDLVSGVDSLVSQMHAIGTRHANPLLVGVGVRFDGPDTFKFGRSIGIPPGADAKYLEATMAGVSVLLEQSQAQLRTVRDTLPHFGLFNAGSNASGEALRTLGADFVSYIEGIRSRVYGAIAKVTAYALAMERNTAYLGPVFVVGAGPVLPPDQASTIATLRDLVADGLLRRSDAIRHLQRIGLIPAEQSPEAYEASIVTSEAERDARAMDRLDDLRARGVVASDASDPERLGADLDALVEELTGAEPDLAGVVEELRALKAMLGPRGG